MTLKTVTLHLPDTIMLRAKQAANILQQPVEELLTTMLTAMLPDVENAPLDMQVDLTNMTWFSNQQLWDVAHSTMLTEQQGQLYKLAELQTERSLKSDEQESLEILRQEYGRITLRKARAYALLSLRSGRFLLADNEPI